MKILFLTQYFPPEIEVGGTRIYETALRFIKKGHQVTVLTGFPNYPRGKIFDSYRGRIFFKEEKDRIKIIRSWIYPYHKGSFLKRIFNQLSFTISSILAIPTIPASDMVVVATPPVFTGLSGWVISRIKKIPFIMEIRDIWPETAVVLGILKNNTIITLGKKLNVFLFRKAHLLITVSDDMKKAIHGYSIDKDKIKIIPNGVDTDYFKRENKINYVRKKNNLGDSFLSVYIGTFGVIHALEQILQTAHLLKDEPEIKFLLVGDGIKKEHLVKIKEDLKLDNLLFFESVPKHQVKDYIVASDVCLSPRKKLKDARLNFPAKIFEYMACEKPVILSESHVSEAKRVLEEAQAGIWTEPENSKKIAEAILKLKQSPEMCKQMGHNGREYVVQHYSRNVLSDKYLRILNNAAR